MKIGVVLRLRTFLVISLKPIELVLNDLLIKTIKDDNENFLVINIRAFTCPTLRFS